MQVRNPHSVLAALRARPAEVQEIVAPGGVIAAAEKGGDADPWMAVVRLARQKKVRVTAGGGRDREARGAPEEGRASTAFGTLKEKTGVSAEELFANASERAGGKGLWLALDSLTDPHNVGAIFRTAAFFGVQGIFMTQERSAPLSAVAYEVSSGGIETVPFCIQPNLQRGFEVAKERGLWILGTSEHASDDLSKIERDRPWLLVMGNEEKGMRRLTEESCDLLCKITARGEVTSLNVSVAAGILIAHLSV